MEHTIPQWFVLLQGLVAVVAVLIVGISCVVFVQAGTILFGVYGVPRLLRLASWSIDHARQITIVTTSSITLIVCTVWQWYFFWDTDDIPDISEMINYAPPQIGYIYDSRGAVLIELATVFRKPVQYDEVPLVMQQAIIAAEDKNFFEHDGIPVLCMNLPFAEHQACVPLPLELAWRWISGKGGSTLTMQLARNHYLNDMLERERSSTLVYDSWFTRFMARQKSTPWVNRRIRKFREIKYALHLERQMREYARVQIESEMREKGYWWPQRWWQARDLEKRRAKEILLSRYLSTVYFGYSMYGPDSASRFYFNKPMANLTPDEAAFLASVAPAPSKFATLKPTPDARERQIVRRNTILERMGWKQFIVNSYDCGQPTSTWDSVRTFLQNELPRGDCRNEVAFYGQKPIALIGRLPGNRTEAPATIQTALDEIGERGFSGTKLFDGAIRIRTTTDLRLQRIVNRAAARGSEIYKGHYPESTLPQLAVIVLRNRDAAILAQFGGYTEPVPNNWTHLDRTRSSIRQAGSAFKPFVYLAALSDGQHSPDSVVADFGPYPVRMGGGWYHGVQNYDRKYLGWISFREALAQSRNVPAMHIGLEYTSIDHVIGVARSVGIHSKLRREPSTIIGASDVTLLELTNGFRAIASDGVVAEPFIIDSVTNSFGVPLYAHEQQNETHQLEIPMIAIRGAQELLRGAVRIPRGTGHSLDTSAIGAPLMCKTGTSSNYADARIVCSTWGPDGITVGIWTGFDDSIRSLGEKATGGRLALPVARIIIEEGYRNGSASILGAPPSFPADMEARITAYIETAYAPVSAK